MRKLVRTMGVASLVAVVTVVAIGALAITRPAMAAVQRQPWAHGGGGGRGLCGQAGLDAAAKALKMTSDQLSTQLWGGESLADLATTAGVDLQTVRDAVTAACNQATKDSIEKAVTAGTLTRDKADWLIVGLDKGYWGGAGDFGFGDRGFRGHGRPGIWGPPITPTPSSNS